MNADRDRVLANLLAAENVAQVADTTLETSNGDDDDAVAGTTLETSNDGDDDGSSLLLLLARKREAKRAKERAKHEETDEEKRARRLAKHAAEAAKRLKAVVVSPLSGPSFSRGIVVIHRSDCQLPLARVRILLPNVGPYNAGLAAPPLPPMPLWMMQPPPPPPPPLQSPSRTAEAREPQPPAPASEWTHLALSSCAVRECA